MWMGRRRKRLAGEEHEWREGYKYNCEIRICGAEISDYHCHVPHSPTLVHFEVLTKGGDGLIRLPVLAKQLCIIVHFSTDNADVPPTWQKRIVYNYSNRIFLHRMTVGES